MVRLRGSSVSRWVRRGMNVVRGGFPAPEVETLEDRNAPTDLTSTSLSWLPEPLVSSLLPEASAPANFLGVMESGSYPEATPAGGQNDPQDLLSAQLDPVASTALPWAVPPGIDQATLSNLISANGLPTSPLNTANGDPLLDLLRPQIIAFDAAEIHAYQFDFWGQVWNPVSGACLMVFGGIPSLEGQTCWTTSYGYFSMHINIAPNEAGVAWAVAINAAGLTSDVATADVVQTPMGKP